MRDIIIFFDSQTVIQSLESVTFNTKTSVKWFHNSKFTLFGRQTYLGNELTRYGTTLSILSKDQSLCIPLATC